MHHNKFVTNNSSKMFSFSWAMNWNGFNLNYNYKIIKFCIHIIDNKSQLTDNTNILQEVNKTWICL